MITTLTPHENGAALVIDKDILESLKIDIDTPLEIVTNGDSLVVSPVRNHALDERLTRALAEINDEHGETLKKLAK